MEYIGTLWNKMTKQQQLPYQKQSQEYNTIALLEQTKIKEQQKKQTQQIAIQTYNTNITAFDTACQDFLTDHSDNADTNIEQQQTEQEIVIDTLQEQEEIDDISVVVLQQNEEEEEQQKVIETPPEEEEEIDDISSVVQQNEEEVEPPSLDTTTQGETETKVSECVEDITNNSFHPIRRSSDDSDDSDSDDNDAQTVEPTPETETTLSEAAPCNSQNILDSSDDDDDADPETEIDHLIRICKNIDLNITFEKKIKNLDSWKLKKLVMYQKLSDHLNIQITKNEIKAIKGCKAKKIFYKQKINQIIKK